MQLPQTKFNSRRSLRDALKRSAREASFAMSFTLRKKDYVIILDRIKNGNIALQRLADQNIELEPTRRSGSQFQLARLIRDLSQGIFKAFQNVLECNCTSHDLGLEIDMRKATRPFDQEQDAIAKSLQFDIVVTMDDQIQAQRWIRWDRIRVQLADTGFPPGPIKLHCSSSSLSSSPKPRSERRVKFAPVFDSHASDRTSALPSDEHISSQFPAFTSKSPLVPSNPITNLCRLLQKGKGAISDCYGSITDKSRKFNLYAQRCHPETSIAVQLRKILEEENQLFDYPERLKVALLLSYSVFHHYNTPWLAKIITVDDVLFFRQQSTKNIHTSDFLDKPLLTKQLLTNKVSTTSASTYCAAKPHSSNTRRINWTLLSLGFLLIQIIMGSTVKDLDITSEMDFDCLLSKQEVASKLCEGRLMLMHGGLNYTEAARWCLKNFLNGASLEDEKFCHEFHAEVIDRLEVDLGHQTIKF